MERAYCHPCGKKTVVEIKADAEKRCAECGKIYWESLAKTGSPALKGSRDAYAAVVNKEKKPCQEQPL